MARQFMSLAEVAQELGVSRQRVQQLLRRENDTRRCTLAGERCGKRVWLVARSELRRFQRHRKKQQRRGAT